MVDRLRALRAGSSYDFRHNATPKCPHCGSDFGIDEGEAWFVFDDNDSHELECPSCDQTFQVHSHSAWTFSTDEQDEY